MHLAIPEAENKNLLWENDASDTQRVFTLQCTTGLKRFGDIACQDIACSTISTTPESGLAGGPGVSIVGGCMYGVLYVHTYIHT